MTARRRSRAVAEFKPHFAFVDIGMPGMDGYETARQIRMLPEGKDIVLVALSGWGRDEDRRRAIEAGFDRHFVKPMEIDALENLLGLARSRHINMLTSTRLSRVPYFFISKRIAPKPLTFVEAPLNSPLDPFPPATPVN